MSAPIYPKASRRESFAGRDFLDAARHNDPTPNRPASPAPASPAPDSPAGRAVVTIFDAVQQTARQKGWWAVSAVIGRALREDRKLHSRERRYVGDTVHSLLRQLRRLRAIIGGKKSK